MTAAKVLYLTDDRESYSRGAYYYAYQQAFERNADVTLRHPLEPLPDPDGFAAVVLGQAAIENFARLFGKRFIPRAVQTRLWFRHAGLRALRRTRTPVVLFTKNDYKHFAIKNSFIAYLRPRLVVTQHRSALTELHNPEGRLIWLPFGVDTMLFTAGAPAESRPYAVGFRANVNTQWNDGVRERFFRALGRLEHKRKVSLTMSRKGEGFLVGKAYADWLRSCSIIGNTVSAVGTVGPRFLEAMACGTVTVAPPNDYEGLLVADHHYIPVEPGADGSFPGLEAAVDRFFTDAAYRDGLQHHARSLVAAHNVDRHVVNVLGEVGVS